MRVGIFLLLLVVKGISSTSMDKDALEFSRAVHQVRDHMAQVHHRGTVAIPKWHEIIGVAHQLGTIKTFFWHVKVKWDHLTKKGVDGSEDYRPPESYLESIGETL